LRIYNDIEILSSKAYTCCVMHETYHDMFYVTVDIILYFHVYKKFESKNEWSFFSSFYRWHSFLCQLMCLLLNKNSNRTMLIRSDDVLLLLTVLFYLLLNSSIQEKYGLTHPERYFLFWNFFLLFCLLYFLGLTHSFFLIMFVFSVVKKQKLVMISNHREYIRSNYNVTVY
jgi:hypothetical protein